MWFLANPEVFVNELHDIWYEDRNNNIHAPVLFVENGSNQSSPLRWACSLLTTTTIIDAMAEKNLSYRNDLFFGIEIKQKWHPFFLFYSQKPMKNVYPMMFVSFCFNHHYATIETCWTIFIILYTRTISLLLVVRICSKCHSIIWWLTEWKMLLWSKCEGIEKRKRRT